MILVVQAYWPIHRNCELRQNAPCSRDLWKKWMRSLWSAWTGGARRPWAPKVTSDCRTSIFHLSYWPVTVLGPRPPRLPTNDWSHTYSHFSQQRTGSGGILPYFSTKSCTYIYMGYTYNCMGGARCSFCRLTYKYCVLDPSKTSFSQVLSILHTLLSLIFFRAHRNTVQCAEHLYIHLHSNDTHTFVCIHTFHTYKQGSTFSRIYGPISQVQKLNTS